MTNYYINSGIGKCGLVIGLYEGSGIDATLVYELGEVPAATTGAIMFAAIALVSDYYRREHGGSRRVSEMYSVVVPMTRWISNMKRRAKSPEEAADITSVLILYWDKVTVLKKGRRSPLPKNLEYLFQATLDELGYKELELKESIMDNKNSYRLVMGETTESQCLMYVRTCNGEEDVLEIISIHPHWIPLWCWKEYAEFLTNYHAMYHQHVPNLDELHLIATMFDRLFSELEQGYELDLPSALKLAGGIREVFPYLRGTRDWRGSLPDNLYPLFQRALKGNPVIPATYFEGSPT